MDSSRIIVGVDGSPPSQAALRWAVQEAARRHVDLVVATAYDWHVVGARLQVGGGYAEALQEAAQSTVDSALAQAKAVDPNVTVTGTTVAGAPAAALLDLADDAGMVVVGSRGHGGFSGLLVGSVSQQVATHAPVPVVVVRGQVDAADRPVLVGVDGSPVSQRVLGTAFAEADARGVALMAVTVCPQALPPWGPEVAPYVDDEGQARLQAAREELADLVASWAKTYPKVVVDQSVVAGHAGETLTDLSRLAQLVVVGTRGHGGFAGLLLGAVGVQLIHHADCPVFIERGRPAGPVS